MGHLMNGVWEAGAFPTDASGRFVRAQTTFRDWIRADGSSRYTADAGRYHLYVSLACPWAHRTVIMRRLKKLGGAIGLSVVDPLMGDDGWRFSSSPGAVLDTVNHADFLREVYLKAKPDFTGRVTVPVLWDKKNAKNR